MFHNWLKMLLFSYCNNVTHTSTENCPLFFVLKEAIAGSQSAAIAMVDQNETIDEKYDDFINKAYVQSKDI